MTPDSKHRASARKSAQRKNGKLAQMAVRVQEAGDLPEPPDRETLIRLLGVEAMNGHVPAIRLLLEELRRDDNSDTGAGSSLAVVHELQRDAA